LSISVKNSESLSQELLEIVQQYQQEQNPVVFPVPIKPDPSVRITRREIMHIDESELPLGIVEEQFEISVAEEKEQASPSVSVSLGRTVGSTFHEARSNVQLGNAKNRWRSVTYKLASGYEEAETLSNNILNNLRSFSQKMFTSLDSINFTHLK